MRKDKYEKGRQGQSRKERFWEKDISEKEGTSENLNSEKDKHERNTLEKTILKR